MMKNNAYLRAALAALGQMAAMTGFCALLIYWGIAVDWPGGGPAYDTVMWALVPVLGFFSAWGAVRIGLFYGLAWIAPPLCQVLAHWLIVGVLPASPGMPMVCLLLAALGGSVGEEQMRRKRKAQKKAAKRGEELNGKG